MTLDPAEFRRIESADVFCGGQRAGQLQRREEHIEFSYLPDYLSMGGRAAAVTLPLREEPYHSPGGMVPAFFAGLLPEGVRLQAVIEAVNTSPDDELSLLLAVGGDTVGAVTVVPEGGQPRDPAPEPEGGQPGEASFGEMFARSVQPPRPQLDKALPGVQEKLSDALISFPVKSGGGPAILKLSPDRYPRLVENEAFFLKMAGACGLRVPPHRIVKDRFGTSGLLVERFDRLRTAGRVVRLPQEDACQLIGRRPVDKYRLSLREVAGAVTAAVAAPAVAVLELTLLTAFSYLIGNGDCHGKNISVRWLPEERMAEVTPMYDLLSTAPYNLYDRLALPMDGRDNRIRGKDLVRFAKTWEVPTQLVQRKLENMLQRAEPWPERVGEIGLASSAAERLVRTMRSRMEELRTF